MNDKIKVVTDSSFEADVINSTQPVLVDFWAPWCPPCRMVSPILEEISQEKEGEIKVAKLNVDENQSLAFQYGVESIPTLLVFVNGKLRARAIGARTKELYLQMIDDIKSKVQAEEKQNGKE